jgi:2-dehydropantoate 2-reductase
VRHAILGAGGIGGLLAAALARTGCDVVLLMRPDSLERYDGRLAVESAVLGDFEVDVPAVVVLDRGVDALWVTTKATQLGASLALAPPERVGDSIVIPLLNGVDHLALLRTHYHNVVAATIRVESERLSSTRIRQRSPFIRMQFAGAEPIADEVRAAGIDCTNRADELSLLWDKLAFLAPLALATTALDAPLGAVREDERYRGCQNEALAVARAEGAQIDEEALRTLQAGAPPEMQSSMQRDVAAGREPELDAIAGPILRGGLRHRIPVPNTDALVELVAARLKGSK